MSIIYGKGILNETIIIPVIGDKSSSHSRSDSNYEVLLPVIFIILFVLVLFLVYAYNNLNLKQKVADYVCYFGRSRRRRRHWQYAQHYGPQYNSQPIHHSHAYQFGHVSQLQKSMPPFNGAPNQNTFEVSSHPTMANFKMSTFSGKEGPMTSRRQNVYYTYKRPDSSVVAASTLTTTNTATSQYYKILKSQEAKKANRVSNNYVVMNSDGVIYSPNYAYRLNQIYDESSGASSSSVSTTDYRLPSASQTHINRLNPLFSSGNRSSQLAIHYSHSNINRESYQAESSGELKHSMNDYQFSPIAFNINETTTSQNRHHVSAASSSSSMRKSLSRRFLANGRDSMKLKQRSSTFKTLNTTAEDISECDYDDGVDDDELMANTTSKSWRRSSSGSRLSVMRPPRRLSSKISSRFKNLSSESSLLKAIRQMTNNSSSENHDINHLVLSNYSLSNAAANRQFRYARLAKSFSFVSNKRKQLIIDPPKIAEQQEILNLNKNTNHNKFLSQPNQLNSLSDDKQDVGVQTSSTNFSITTTTSSSREDESSGDATNTMMQTNTFGSILANLGSVPTRPSSMISRSQQHQQQGVFEINRALLRSRAFSDGNGLSNIQQTNYNHNTNTNSSNSFIIPHSVSSSKLFYKKF